MSSKHTDDFARTVWQYYHAHKRDMPWRHNPDFYRVLVSEMMLQQTQVSRVIPKFTGFIESFANVESLAKAPLSDVLRMWQGLGYNRRAKYLHQAAQAIVAMGRFPVTSQEIISLPGVGKNTAGAIEAYVYNHPAIFIETNIRTVMIHHFFNDAEKVDDKDIELKVSQTVDANCPREWYYALMDYGAFLKKTDTYLSKSRHYKKQSPLKGSVREMRGKIIRLLSGRSYFVNEMERLLSDDDRYRIALESLVNDGLVETDGAYIKLTGEK